MAWRDDIELLWWRTAMSGLLPGRWWCRPPPRSALTARRGKLTIEIVSHCWQYGHLLAYQLSSVAANPPREATLTMTVFHATEDQRTTAVLAHFKGLAIDGVRWNFQALPSGELFRRSIGRHRASKASAADWLWYTDCDIVFEAGCIDGLAAALQGRNDPLVYPREERVTPMLQAEDPILAAAGGGSPFVRVDAADFTPLVNPPKAKGAYQIVHGDFARTVGYCAEIGLFQRPAPRWAKTYEDSAYRWLVGEDGVGIDVPAIYRIRHVHKGRYGDNDSALAKARSGIRRAKAGITER
jgi:hypothetical protein